MNPIWRTVTTAGRNWRGTAYFLELLDERDEPSGAPSAGELPERRACVSEARVETACAPGLPDGAGKSAGNISLIPYSVPHPGGGDGAGGARLLGARYTPEKFGGMRAALRRPCFRAFGRLSRTSGGCRSPWMKCGGMW